LLDRHGGEPEQERLDVLVTDVRKYWYSRYGEVRAASSQMFSPSDLPNLVPSERTISGAVRPWTASPRRRRTRSTPAVMLPHWSDPATWRSHAWLWCRTSKSLACRSM